MKNLIVTLLIIIQHLLSNAQAIPSISVLTDLPSQLKETSGIASSSIVNHYWSHNNKFVNGDPFVLGDLHLFNATDGTTQKTIKINSNDIINLSDMEDMAEDDSGNHYVGDIGSASTNKTVFRIYKINNINDYEDGETVVSELINFSYPNNRSYNAEAMFWYDNYLYIFTKGFGNSDTLTVSFRVPDSAGNYVAEHLETVVNNDFSPAISSADINTADNTIALLAYQKCILIKCFTAPYFFNGSEIQFIEFDGPQNSNINFRSEAVMFTNEFNCIGTNEFKDNPPVSQGVFEFDVFDYVQSNFSCLSSNCGIIENYNFNDSFNNWETGIFGSASNVSFTIENDKANILMDNGGDAMWQVRLKQEYFNTDIATTYRISFYAYANFNRAINLLVGQKIDGIYTGYTNRSVDLTTAETYYEYNFTNTEPSNSFTRIAFDCGAENSSEVYIDNVCIEAIECPGYVFLDDSISSANYSAAQTLESRGQLKQQADVVLTSNSVVRLKEGFSVPLSASLQVKIEDCPGD